VTLLTIHEERVEKSDLVSKVFDRLLYGETGHGEKISLVDTLGKSAEALASGGMT
jgi:hypothetical protein